VYFAPESVVYYTPDSIVYFTPEYSELLFYKIRELEKYQFIISKSIYEERGILGTEFTAEELLGNPPSNLDFNYCGFQLMITTNGEEYIDNKTIIITKNWIIEKRNFWITFIGIIVAIVTFIVNLIFYLLPTLEP
jgi:hypothetical protein